MDTKLGIRKITARVGAEITGLSPALTLDAVPAGIDGSRSYPVKGDASHYALVAQIQAAA
jgi:hypothetical protein